MPFVPNQGTRGIHIQDSDGPCDQGTRSQRFAVTIEVGLDTLFHIESPIFRVLGRKIRKKT